MSRFECLLSNSSCAATYRCKPNDPKQRTWYVFDQALVLPEYLVEFEYEQKGDGGAEGSGGAGSAAGGVAAMVGSEAARYQELTHSAMTPRAKTELEKLEFDIWPIARRGLGPLAAPSLFAHSVPVHTRRILLPGVLQRYCSLHRYTMSKQSR